MAIPVPEKRVSAFEEMGLGMFVHYGLYSQLGRGEWVRYLENIPGDVYDGLADTFTASAFDGQALARLAKAAGARYITLTTRHHDGFSLYDTKGLSTFDAPHSAAGRDLIRSFVDGCRTEGITPFFYHTTLDWRHPAFTEDFPAYLQYLRDSIEVLCTEYGPIGGFWFDGNWSKPDADWEEDALYAVIRKHQPEVIIVNNTGLDARGEVGNPAIDSVTFEQGRPEPMNREGMKKYYAAEMCHTMNAHWGHGAADLNYKSLPDLIETLCACRRAGANYLLNIGLMGEGDVSLMQRALMTGVGDWIRMAGHDSVYKGKPCGVVGHGRDFALRDGDRIWFYIHSLSSGGDSHVTVDDGCEAGERVFDGLCGAVEDLHWTDNGEELSSRFANGRFYLKTTGYTYGKNLVVRVAQGICR